MQGNSEMEILEKDGEKSQSHSLIASKRIGSSQPDLRPGEHPTVTLDPEQVEEIHVDDYSLLLFSATRIEPLSISEIKQQFPEPTPKKAQSVMDRFVAVGLVHLNKDGRYYSNYPHYYVNWGKYRYEADIVARSDARVFQLVKDFFGIKEYWKDKMYFSIDAFFTPEQSAELREMFMEIKVKAKKFAQANAQAGKMEGLKFRRMKFFDMIFGVLLAVTLSIGVVDNSYAEGGSGTGPVSFMPSQDTIMLMRGGSGTDPTFAPECLSPSDVQLIEAIDNGGGGYDPTGRPRVIQIDNDGGGGHDPTSKPGVINTDDGGTGGGGHDPSRLINYEDESCKLGTLMHFVRVCKGTSNEFCKDVKSQAIKIWNRIKKVDRGMDI